MQKTNFDNLSFSGNDDSWYSVIGGYGADSMLDSLVKIDPGSGCGGCCSKGSAIIEGFDGITDHMINTITDEFTVTTGLIGKVGSGGTSTAP